MSDLKYEIELKIDKASKSIQDLVNQGQKAGQKIGTEVSKGINSSGSGAKSAGAKVGADFGNAFAQVAGGIISALSFQKLAGQVFNSVQAFNSAEVASQSLGASIDFANKKQIESQAIINDTTKSYEEQALAIGFNTKDIYENTKAGVDGSKQISKAFIDALSDARKQGAKIVDKKQVEAQVKFLADKYKEVGLSEQTIISSFNRLSLAGLTDINEMTKTTEGFIKIASTSRLPLTEGVAQLAEQFQTEIAALGERAGLTDEYASQIGPRGLAILQAEGKLRGKNYQELTKEERALAKSAGLRQNIEVAQGAFNAKVEKGGFAFDRFSLAVEKLSIAFGRALKPAFDKVFAVLTPFVEKIVEFAQNNPQLVATITIVVGAITALAGAVLFLLPIVSTLISAWSTVSAFLAANAATITALKATFVALSGPIGITILVVGALIALFVQLWKTNESFRNAVIKVWQDVVNWVMWAKDNWLQALGQIIGFFVTMPQRIAEYLLQARQAMIEWAKNQDWSAIGEGIKNAIINGVKDALKFAGEAITKFGEGVKDFGKGVAQGAKIPGFAKGGEFIVPQGYSKDKFFMPGLGMLNSGEKLVVQPANSVTGSYNTNQTTINYNNTGNKNSTSLAYGF